jgi:hypothetical protein
MFFDKFLRRSNYDWEKLQKEKKECVSFFGECSRITIFHILKNENYELWFLAGFFVDEIMTGKKYDRKKSTMLVYLVLWGNSFWYYIHT